MNQDGIPKFINLKQAHTKAMYKISEKKNHIGDSKCSGNFISKFRNPINVSGTKIRKTVF